jgi:hypothetical protein
MKNILSNMRVSTDLSIVVIRYSQGDVLELLSEVSDVRLRFMMINDTPFLQSLVPSSTLYSPVFDERSEVSLDPVV